MKYPVVLVNARAGRVAQDPALPERLRQQVPAENVHVSRSPEELLPTLRDARDAGIDTLVLLGGDGSLAPLLTPLLRIWPHDVLPAIVLAGGGRTNAIARSLGTRGAPEAILARLLAAPEPLPVSRHFVLEVRPAGLESSFGLTLTLGLPARWISRADATAGRGALGTLAASLETLGSLARGSDLARELCEPIELDLIVDGTPLPREQLTGLAAATVEEIGVGARVITGATGHGRFRLALTDAGTPRAGFEYGLQRLGLRVPLSSVEQLEARSVEIDFADRSAFSIDTEPFPATSSVGVGVGPQLRFVSP